MTPSPLVQTLSQNVTFTVTGVSNANSGSIRVFSDYEVANGDPDGDTYTLTPYWVNVNMSNHPTSGTSTKINVQATVRNSCGNTGTCTASFNRVYAPTATIASPNIVVRHFGDPDPTTNISVSSVDESGDLNRMDIYGRKCSAVSPSLSCSAWSSANRLIRYDYAKAGVAKVETYPVKIGASFGYWNLVVNARDTGLRECTGNPDYASFPAPDGSFNCDSDPSVGGTDSVITKVVAAPTAWITASSLVVTPGVPINFSAGASDPELNLNQIEMTRRECTDPSCTSFVPYTRPDNGVVRTDGWYSPYAVGVGMMCTASFPQSFTYVYSGCSWTPTVSDIGTWQVAVNAIDSNSPRVGCSGNPDGERDGFPFQGWWNCGNNPSLNDYVTITVQDNATITGNLVEVVDEATCDTKNGSPLNVSGAEVNWYTGSTTYSSPSVGISGSYQISSDSSNVIMESIYLTNVPILSDKTLEPVCVSDRSANPTGFMPQGTGFAAPDGYTIAGPVVLDLAYKLSSSLDGWFTSIDGDVYSGGVIAQNMPTNLAGNGGFTGTLLQTVDSPSAYAFANLDIDIKASGDVERVFNDAGGSAKNMGATSFGISEFKKFEAPDHAISIDASEFQGLEAKVYSVSFGDFKTALGAGNYEVTDGKTAVVYIEDSGDDIVFSGDFTSSGGRMLLLTNNTVIISGAVGNPSPGVGALPQIEAFIISSKGIVVEDSPDGAEKTLIVEGGLVSTSGKVDVQRDRGLSNNYPSLVVRYDPVYLYSLTKQEREDSSNTLYPDLFTVNIEWKDKENE
ncbi:MAG: hypothetical protein WC243_01475 [Patescibacteria group bacterium]|jgi:hypothetical protein